MLIISKNKNKDYYDGVVGTTGIDKTIVYKRNLIEFNRNEIPDSFRILDNFGRFYHLKTKKEYGFEYFDTFIVGFCGNLYLGWVFYEKVNPFPSTGFEKKIIERYVYDVEIVKTYFEDKNHNDIDNIVNRIKYTNVIDLFREFKTPVFVFTKDNGYKFGNKQMLYVNPILSDYEFYKVFKSYDALQEIQMFIGGVLGSGEKEIIEVEDKYKIEQHGFDKFSFRKEKK